MFDGGFRSFIGESVTECANYQPMGESSHYGPIRGIEEMNPISGRIADSQRSTSPNRGDRRDTPAATALLMTTAETSLMDTIPREMRELVTQQRNGAVRKTSERGRVG